MSIDKTKFETWKQKAEAAGDGKITVRRVDGRPVEDGVEVEMATADAEFYAAAREALPALIDEVDRRASWILRLQKTLQTCPECGSQTKLWDGGFYHHPQCPLGRLVASL